MSLGNGCREVRKSFGSDDGGLSNSEPGVGERIEAL
jgi:hypothetical protein